MAKRKSSIATFAADATRYTAHASEKAIAGLARWVVTDHSGTAKLLSNLPPMGFIDTLSTLLVTALCGVLGAVVSGALVVLLIGFGIPLLLGA